jgi:putative addiction module component (TIGR02574 family)
MAQITLNEGLAWLKTLKKRRVPFSSSTMHNMTRRTSQLLQDVLALPVGERAVVAAELLASLDDTEPTDMREVAAAWAEEIERRARRVLSGESTGSSWDVIRHEIESDLGNR